MDIPWQLPGDKLTNPVLSYTDYKQIRLLTYIARYRSPGAPDFGHTCKHLGGSQAMKGQRAETSRCPTWSKGLSCKRIGTDEMRGDDNVHCVEIYNASIRRRRC